MIIGEKDWRNAITNPLQRLPYVQVKTRHAIQTMASSVKHVFMNFGASAGFWSKRFAVVLLVELALVLLLHFCWALPLMLLVIPLIALDYVGFAGVVLYMKFMVSFIR